MDIKWRIQFVVVRTEKFMEQLIIRGGLDDLHRQTFPFQSDGHLKIPNMQQAVNV